MSLDPRIGLPRADDDVRGPGILGHVQRILVAHVDDGRPDLNRLVRAPTAARSGNGEPSWRAKWCTRKYAPSAPSSSAATASSIDCSSASDADRVCEPGDDDQCPNDRKPIFFTSASTRAARAPFLASEAPAACLLS